MVCDEDKVREFLRKIVKMINELEGLIYVGRIIMISLVLNSI